LFITLSKKLKITKTHFEGDNLLKTDDQLHGMGKTSTVITDLPG